jgi:parallel beta-helix repeat protein
VKAATLLLLCLLQLSFFTSVTFNRSNGTTNASSLTPDVTIILYVGEMNGSNSGFGFNSTSLTFPGPTLSFHIGDLVSVTLINIDQNKPHAWSITDAPTSNATVLFNAQIGSSLDPLPPGTNGSVLFTPTQMGAFYYLCPVSGHIEQGEIGAVIVQHTLLTFAAYIKPDGSVSPSTAPIQQNGDTYILNGTISTNQDGIRIEKDNVILDGAGYTVQGTRTGTGVDLTDRNNVTVANITVTKFFNGVLLNNASDNDILKNHVSANANVGIALFSSSSNNTIVENNVENNTSQRSAVGIAVENSCNNNTISRNNVTNNDSGIYPLYDCSGNVVSENNVTTNSYGISLLSAYGNSFLGNVLTNNGNSFSLRSSSNNTLRNNSISGAESHFAVEGGDLSDFLNDVDASNTVEGKPVYYWINTDGATVPLDAGYVALVNCSAITVHNLTLTLTEEQSILLAYTANSTVTSNHIAANASGVEDYGVQLVHSNGNTVEENTISYRTYAIRLQNYCTDNVVTMNNITSDGQGIDLDEDSTNNTVSNNNVTDTGNGIFLEYDANSNVIIGNSVTRTYVYAIRISFTSNNNLITRNDVTNSSCAVGLEYSSSSNIFYENNFVDNARQVVFYEGNSTNFWDNGSEGNYWSDYNGTDSDHDGIGNQSYIIDANNTDHYPLMGKFQMFTLSTPSAGNQSLYIISNSTVSSPILLYWLSSPYHGLQPGQPLIQFTAAGQKGTVGFCRLMIPTAVLNSSTYIVLVDSQPVNATELPISNSTYTYLYFTYPHSTHEVIVTTPEFPSLILPLFMVVTVLAVAIFKKTSRLA